jgi:hypothetical protein
MIRMTGRRRALAAPGTERKPGDESLSMSKQELHDLADGLFLEVPSAVERCVEFVVSETCGHWHGRARAMMCRRLKHCPLTQAQSRRLVECIAARLVEGRFSEQFKDQLRLALHLNPARTFQQARAAQSSPLPHVRRYAGWVLSHGVASDDA